MLIILCLLLTQCSFKPVYDTADHTLYAGDLIFNIHSNDAVLNNRLQRELKIIAQPLMKKPYVVDIQLNAKQSPILYDEYGGTRRWHASLHADVIVHDKYGNVIQKRQIWTRQSFDHNNDEGRLQLVETFDDQLAKDLAQQIVTQCVL